MVWEKYKDVEVMLNTKYLVHTIDDEIVILKYNNGIWYGLNGVVISPTVISSIITIKEVRKTIPVLFKIVITETLTVEVEEPIKATSKEEALEEAWDKYYNADPNYVLSGDDLTAVNIEAHEIY